MCLTEAAFTLLLYWELLHWEERPLREFLHYPAQSEWHRKEALCRKVIHYFNKGKVFTDISLFLQQFNTFWNNSYIKFNWKLSMHNDPPQTYVRKEVKIVWKMVGGNGC